jgi:hypothetical protein
MESILRIFLWGLFPPYFYRVYFHHISMESILSIFLWSLFSPYFYGVYSLHISMESILFIFRYSLFFYLSNLSTMSLIYSLSFSLRPSLNIYTNNTKHSKQSSPVDTYYTQSLTTTIKSASTSSESACRYNTFQNYFPLRLQQQYFTFCI